MRFAPNGRVYLRGIRVESGWFPLSGEVEVPGVIYEPGTNLWLRTEVVGTNPTTLRLKAWPAGAAEPVAWLYTTTDSSTALQAAGQIGFRAYVPSGVQNTPLRVFFDDLLVVEP